MFFGSVPLKLRARTLGAMPFSLKAVMIRRLLHAVGTE